MADQFLTLSDITAIPSTATWLAKLTNAERRNEPTNDFGERPTGMTADGV
jgi:hypothetical protein